MLKGLLGGMASFSKGLTGMGGGSGSRKGSGELKRKGLTGIFADKKTADVHTSHKGDMDLPLSGSANPDHRAIARRRIGGMRPSAPPANMEKGEKKGIFSRLMDMKKKYNPLDRAVAPLGKKESGMRSKTNRYEA